MVKFSVYFNRRVFVMILSNFYTMKNMKCFCYILVPLLLGSNIHRISYYGTGIVFYWKYMLSWLSFHNFVWWSLNTHILFISSNICDLFSKSNSSIYYLWDCSIIFKKNQTDFVNINKKPRYSFLLFSALLAENHQKFTKNDGITLFLLPFFFINCDLTFFNQTY